VANLLKPENNEFGPTLAASLRYDHPDSRIQTIIDNSLGVEYTPAERDFSSLGEQLGPLLQSGVRIRFHGFLPQTDIGDDDSLRSEQALKVHQQCLDAMVGIGEPFITFHTGLNLNLKLDYSTLVKNLAFLVSYGRERGIHVQIENLKSGLTSDPDVLWDLAQKTEAGITLDLGHAVSSEAAASGKWRVTDIVDLFQDRLSEVHFYEKELDRHYPPENLEVLGPVIDRLLLTDCQWWTVELPDNSELVETVDMVRQYFSRMKSEFRN
jgi:sugar phosphate isomerase/epimerase